MRGGYRVGLLAACVLVLAGCLPKFPTGAVISVSNLTPTSVMLDWPAGADSDPHDTVTAYQLKRDGVQIALVSELSQSCKLVDLEPGTTYQFEVRAISTKDPQGTQESSAALVAEVATPALPQNFRVGSGSGVLFDDFPPPDPLSYATGSHYNNPALKFYVENDTPDIPGTQDELDALVASMDLWANASSLTFTRVTNPADATIKVKFAAGAHGDGSAFDGPLGVLAHAILPTTSGSYVHMDEDEQWVLSAAVFPQIDLETVFIHELGHAIGLLHSADTGAIMYASYSDPRPYLGQDDIDGIRTIYPPPTSGGLAACKG